MHTFAVVIGILLTIITLWEAFESFILPRTVIRHFRFTPILNYVSWELYRRLAFVLGRGGLRELYLSLYAPLFVIAIIGIWAFLLLFSWSLILWGLALPIASTGEPADFETYLYLSGVTFFTLGYGDFTLGSPLGHLLIVVETGMGLGFLAVIIGYFPVLYSSFSRREVGVALMDARAGSPSVGVELLRRHAEAESMESLTELLATMETWTSDVMESHLSYPPVAYYRTQHDQQSWLATLTAILDAAAILELGCVSETPWEKKLRWQARMSFAMARHTIVDLAIAYRTTVKHTDSRPLTEADFHAICDLLAQQGLYIRKDKVDWERLCERRQSYEPYLMALSKGLLLPLPPWLPLPDAVDNWASHQLTRKSSHL